MRLLLVCCSTARRDRVVWAEGYSSPPLGLLYLAALARLHGHEVQCLDLMTADLTRHDFTSLLTAYRPHVVGLTVYTESVAEARDVAILVKQACGAKVVAGGPHATFRPESLLSDDGVDYVVTHEGEATLVELLCHLEYGWPPAGAIRGVAFRNADGTVRANQKRPFIQRLDGLPLPALDLVDGGEYTCPLTVLSSRGCPGRCLFCLSPPMHGARYRVHSAERLVSEAYYWCRRHGQRVFCVLDDTFTWDRPRLERFCRLAKKALVGLCWSCYSRVDALTPDLLDMLASAGCIAIQLGIETGDELVSRQINKRISLEDAESVVRHAADAGIMPLCSLMIGHYSDTPDTIRRTIEFGRRLRERYRAVVVYAMCTPFPGSPIHEHCRRLGVQIHARDWNDFSTTRPFISTRHLDSDQIRHWYFEACQEMSGPQQGLSEYWKQVMRSRGLSGEGSGSGAG
ncbi:MAG: B12-binding domain-containing radical SAM protein [Acetobacteraceae bacterium]|nr:B12-binding domain-containing radical SAM protein [Acetobacteraceae bacterium]